MRQRTWGRWGVGSIGAAPGLALAANSVAPTWFAILPDVLCLLAALVLVGFGLWMLYLALVRVDAGEFSFRRHAGSFGGSSTGWQLSQALARLVSGLALILLALALAMARMPGKDDGKAEAAFDEARPASAAASAVPAASAPSAAASAK